MNKKFFRIITALIFTIISFNVYAASTKDQIKKEFAVYNEELNEKIINIMMDLDKDVQKFEEITKKKVDTKEVRVLISSIEKKNNDLIKYMEETSTKLKTPEVIDLHKIAIEFIKIRNEIFKDVADFYNKANRPLTDDDMTKIGKKYEQKLMEVNKKNMQAIEKINKILQ